VSTAAKVIGYRDSGDVAKAGELAASLAAALVPIPTTQIFWLPSK
jgi:hypothetical protein